MPKGEKTKLWWKDPKNRLRMSENHKGYKRTKEQNEKLSKNNPRFWLGKKRDQKTIEKIKKSKLKNPTRYWLGKKGIHLAPQTEFKKGMRPWNYKGGVASEQEKIRSSTENRLWRESVFARDNWTCQKYGIRGGKLNPHHIQNFAQFPELRFAIDNGITLSDKAHKEFHKKYGKKNNTLEQLKEFLL